MKMYSTLLACAFMIANPALAMDKQDAKQPLNQNNTTHESAASNCKDTCIAYGVACIGYCIYGPCLLMNRCNYNRANQSDQNDNNNNN